MMTLFASARLLSAISFVGYGLSCFFSEKMVTEFNRYGVGRHRVLIGTLQIAGSLGLFVGFYYAPLTVISSLGFSLMMFVAILIRFKIKDPLLAAAPAMIFLSLNFYIFLSSLKLLNLTT